MRHFRALEFTATLIIAVVLAACASDPGIVPGVAIDAPREITNAETTGCQELGLVVKQSVRGSQKSFGSERAMKAAMNAVLEAGGDSYRLLDVSEDSPGGGAQVILEAYRCG